MQAPRKPCSLKKIMWIERCVHDTISETWIRIAKRDLLCGNHLVIDIPFHEIARQCANAGKEARAKKRRTPPNDCTVAEMMSHEGDRETIIVNRSSSRTAVRDRDPLVAHSIGDTPVFKNIMGKSSEATLNREDKSASLAYRQEWLGIFLSICKCEVAPITIEEEPVRTTRGM